MSSLKPGMWALDPIFVPSLPHTGPPVILDYVSNTQKETPALGFSCEVWPLTGFLAVSRKGVS